MHVVPSVPACRAVGVIPARCADHGPAELRIAGAFCGDRTVRVGRTVRGFGLCRKRPSVPADLRGTGFTDFRG